MALLRRHHPQFPRFLVTIASQLAIGSGFLTVGVEPETDIGITGSNHFRKHPPTLIFSVDYLKNAILSAGLSIWNQPGKEISAFFAFDYDSAEQRAKIATYKPVCGMGS